MTLSVENVKRLKTDVTSDAAGAELAAAINSQGSGPAALVAALGASTNLPAAACAGAASPSATNVNAAIDTVAAVAETRLDNLETKINAILSALKTAGLMAAA